MGVLTGHSLLHAVFVAPARWRRPLYIVVRIALGLIFLYAGIEKVREAQLFVVAVENYRLLPDFLAPFMAMILPWVEIVAGVLLISGYKALPAVTLINLMLAVFIMALSISFFRGLNIDCGCFSVNITESKHSLSIAILRDFGFLAMGLWVAAHLLWSQKE